MLISLFVSGVGYRMHQLSGTFSESQLTIFYLQSFRVVMYCMQSLIEKETQNAGLKMTR